VSVATAEAGHGINRIIYRQETHAMAMNHDVPTDGRSRRERAALATVTWLALLFEGSLAGIACGLGFGLRLWSTANVNPLQPHHAPPAILIGIAAALPIGLIVLVVEYLPGSAFENLRQVVSRQLVPLFRGCRVIELGAIALAAGVGEELFFRGILQVGLARLFPEAWGGLVGLVGAALLFGVLHWLTFTYALLATLIGCYLGWLYQSTGNLLVPITAHAVYDFAALVYLARWRT
jgi:hypothetical protein